MPYIDNSSESVPLPALLVERATALARAEAGLALVHTRRLAVAAVSALLGTIVACAFAQLTLVLLVTWPVLAARVPLANLIGGVVASVALSASGAGFAISTWLAAARQRRNGAAPREAAPSRPPPAREPATELHRNVAANGVVADSDRPRAVELAERASL
jgi:hypothetical protein